MAPPRIDEPDPAAWGATNLAALEFRAVAARRVAINASATYEVLRMLLLRVADDNRLLIERLRDCGHG